MKILLGALFGTLAALALIICIFLTIWVMANVGGGGIVVGAILAVFPVVGAIYGASK